MILQGDCIKKMRELEPNSVDTIICDPPYDLTSKVATTRSAFSGRYAGTKGASKGFMGKEWDGTGIAFKKETWEEMLRVAKPGSTLMAFGGTRTYHRMACAIEDAGWILKDCIMWLYGSGFPKASDIAKNISKSIDKKKELIYNEDIWNTQLNNAKFAEKIYLNELIEAGLLTTSKEFVAENVIKFLKQKGLNVSVDFAEKDLKEVNLISEEILIVPENVGAKTKQQLLNVPIVELKSKDQNVPLKVKIIFVPLDVRTCLCEKVESKIKEDAVQKTESGNKKFSQKMDINAECVELLENLKHTILKELRSIQNFATMLTTEKLTATNVIITKSIRECLTLSTVDIVGFDKTRHRIVKNHDQKTYSEFRQKDADKKATITEPSTPEAKLWNGWKSHGLKPAYEPIIVAMKPNEGSYANNALKHGVAGLNIDGGRIGSEVIISRTERDGDKVYSGKYGNIPNTTSQGRFPANIILDEEAGRMLGEPSRFFYIAKASKAERNLGCEELEEVSDSEMTNRKEGSDGLDWNDGKGGNAFAGASSSRGTERKNNHPTVKPIKLMEYLCLLTKTPTGGVVLDPFAGSGTTALACIRTGRPYIMIEKDPEYIKIIKARVKGQPETLL